MGSDRTLSVLDEIAKERDWQDKKWGADRSHIPSDWLMILGEEVGEANEAALEAKFGDTSERLNQYKNMRTDLIQVAAVAIATIESLDRNEIRQFSLTAPVSENHQDK